MLLDTLLLLLLLSCSCLDDNCRAQRNGCYFVHSSGHNQLFLQRRKMTLIVIATDWCRHNCICKRKMNVWLYLCVCVCVCVCVSRSWLYNGLHRVNGVYFGTCKAPRRLSLYCIRITTGCVHDVVSCELGFNTFVTMTVCTHLAVTDWILPTTPDAINESTALYQHPLTLYMTWLIIASPPRISDGHTNPKIPQFKSNGFFLDPDTSC